MNQIYFKTKYLFVLLGFFACSVGMAQSPLQNRQSGNAKTALEMSVANPKKDQVSKKTADKVSNQDNDANNLFTPQEEKVKGIELSAAESDAVKKQLQESQKLFRQNLTNVTAKTNPQDSISTKVRSFAKSANLTAKNIFEVKKGDFDLSTSDKMQLKSISDNHGRTLATYQQMHNSIPVEGAIYKVRENKTKIDAFGSTAKKVSVSSNYKINAATALENALRTVNAKQYIWESKKLGALLDKKISAKPQGELVYVGPNFSSELKDYYLAWKFDIYATNPQSSQTMYVDANTGKIILTINLNNDADFSGQSLGKGKSRYSGEVEFNTKQYADGYRLEGLQGKYNVPMYTWNMNHADEASDEVITEFIDEDNIWNELHNKDHDEVAMDIHWGMQKTIEYYGEKFNRNSIDDKGMTIIGLAHLGTNVENASWTGGWAQFGDGVASPYVGLGITAHELTHGVTRFTAGLIYQGESGAMNESFSDIFGVSVEAYVGKDKKENIWMLGNELYTHGSMRSMSNPKAQSQPDTYGGVNWANPANSSYDNGGVHINSGITNYWFYLLSEGGQGTNDLNNSYDVKAIGLDKAEKIAYITLTEYLSPSSNFSDMRQATLMVTEDLYGMGSEEYKQVSNAWYAIGIGTAFADKQIALVSVEKPVAACGTLKGDEPFYITIKNTGSTVIKANESLYYKLRLMFPGFGGRLNTLYSADNTISFDKDLAVGEERVIKTKETIPYEISTTKLNYVEVKFDFKPIDAFGAKDGISFVSSFMVYPPQKDFDLKVTGLSLPEYSGTALSVNHTLAITIFNLGCQDIPAGSQLKVGYANTLPGSETVWKDVTLETIFKGNSEMTISFDTTIDLSANGLHTYEGFVSYDKDPVAANNSGINGVYSGIITQFPYTMDFERTPGGWYSKSLSTNQKFVWQASAYTFRDTKSKYLWATVQLGETGERMALNADFTLQSPVFDFTNVAFPYVEFDIISLFHNGYDGLIVEYSEDNQNWKKVTGIDYPSTLHYDGGSALSGPWFTGINNDFKKKPIGIRLNDLAGKKGAIRFRVATDDYNDGFLGAFIDNIHVDNAPYDLVLLDAKVDAGTCKIDNNNVTIKTKIINNFGTTAEQVNVTVKILDSAQNEVYSKTEKASLVFSKFRDTIAYSIPNINLKSIGRNTISVSVFPDDVTQDATPENNSFTLSYDNWNNEDMKISVLPYTMDFEDVTKYKGWRTFENKDAAGWQHGTYTDLRSPSFFVTDHTQFMASNDDKCNCDAANDMLISPVLDLSNYKEAHLSFDGFGDGQRLSDGYVKVSTDGGETWNTAFKMYYIDNWIEYHVDLTPYAGKSCVLVAFQHDDNGLFANGFAVDNIKITEKSEYLQLSNLSMPEVVYEDAPSHQFFIAARNVFYNKVEKATIEYQITQNGKAVGEPVVSERNDQIQQYQTITYTIDGIPQLPAGNYEINVKIITNGQLKADATTLTKSFEVIAKAPNLDIETFSSVAQGSVFGSKGYVSNQSDDNYPWRNVTTPDNTNLTLPKKDHTEDASAMMLYSQLENYAVYGEIVSPMYKLAENTTALEFYYGMQCNYINSFSIDIKTVGGEWTEIWKDSKQGSYSDTEWKRGAVNLNKYAGKSVMLRLRHAKEGGYSYMVLDDLKLITDPVVDASVQILSPRDICGGSEFKVKLTNEGQIAIAANTIQLEVEYMNTNEVISEPITEGIPVGGSIEYMLKKQPKLDESGDSHVFNVTAKLDNDAIQQNNIIKNYIYQGVPSDFKIFDNPIIYGYAGKALYVDAQTNVAAKKLKVASYKWSTGDVSNGIAINTAGDYTVTLVMKNGCTLTETITAKFDAFESELESGDLCGPEVVLSPGKYKSYEWFDGATEPTHVITESGDYFVTVFNENGIGKTFSTTISILENNIVPEIQVIGDKKLTASVDAASYQWFLNERPIPNATEKSIIAIWEGNYSLQTTNNNGCNRISTVFDSKGMLLGKITNPFRVFPNPAVDNVNIFLADKIEGETKINVYATDGKAVWSKSYASMPSIINLSGLTPGVYVLDCTVQNKKYTAKIIKK
ncbi:M4 family metallopeptidase [Flavobacterium pectinovorum]|uniref:T9SS C-terminal target domain-containing protein n=1 Tax=Flavobacterium pectinovorum TaxID=29533 RepID=A0A502EVM9_9FLAO|nr:M4 family metallopeptidase [Flavobacterium pectinovorum]TPG41958.1 T9SS C-terminal target domain-containing protein [Flavobacterium pectinovorum]